MISIVIASVNKEFLANVKDNIRSTIGCEYEVISFDNSKGQFSLCHLYNLGAQKAKYDLICYMHEDIEIRTDNWGNIVSDLFINNNKLGVLGVVGSSYKPLTPSGWGTDGHNGQTTYSNYIQSYKRSDREITYFINNPGTDLLAKVACVDGLWLCTKKSIALELGFDDTNLQGFHCYDIDYCLNVGQYYEVCVTFNVLINHFSEGSYDKNWLSDTLNVHKKWKEILPKSIDSISLAYQRNLEKIAFKNFILSLFKYGATLRSVLHIIHDYKTNEFMDYQLYLKLKFYALKYYLSKGLRFKGND